jgi:predicted LPLAT superfamily acyltransferase
MKKYENVSSWRVMDELEKGAEVFVIDREKPSTNTAIRKANKVQAGELVAILKSDEMFNRYSCYKVVESEDNAE